MLYLDSSGIVKLVVPEPETNALFELVRSTPALISSIVARAEVTRAIRRLGVSLDRVASALDSIALVPLDEGIVRTAAKLEPTSLRTLDAIHLATALSLGSDITGLVTYDGRLAIAAAAAGVEVLAPGAE